MRRSFASVVLIAVALTSGCAPLPPDAAPSATSTTDAPSSGDATPAAPRQAFLGGPSRIPISCDELVPLAAAASFLLVETAELEAVHGQDPLGEGSVAFAGGDYCTWHGPEFFTHHGVFLSIGVLPEAAAEFATYHSTLDEKTTEGSVESGYFSSCFEDTEGEGIFFCWTSFLVDGSYWVELGASLADVRDPSIGLAFSKEIAERLSAAGPPLERSATLPTEPFGLGLDCASVDDDGLFRSNLGAPGLDEPRSFTRGSVNELVALRSGTFNCFWYSSYSHQQHPAAEPDSIQFELVPGGAWNADAVFSEVAQWGAVPIDVEGLERAAASSDAHSCSLVAVVADSLLVVDIGYPDIAPAHPCVAALKVVELVRAA